MLLKHTDGCLDSAMGTHCLHQPDKYSSAYIKLG